VFVFADLNREFESLIRAENDMKRMKQELTAAFEADR
jgi:hypothetical protein